MNFKKKGMNVESNRLVDGTVNLRVERCVISRVV